jgi:RNA polymerase-binding transcription factor DksA
MSRIIKAKVLSGRYSGEIVRITNVSADELGRKSAACFLANGTRANILVTDLEVIPEVPEKEPEVRRAKTASMPFISGAASSRTMTQTKNMQKPREEIKSNVVSKYTAGICEVCGQEYNIEERKGHPGKITECENCANETETKAEGKMIFSHKTGATIEIKKDGELRHEADTFDPKNKT